jgi:hypothetical protein
MAQVYPQTAGKMITARRRERTVSAGLDIATRRTATGTGS